jgi:hypothetical protein
LLLVQLGKRHGEIKDVETMSWGCMGGGSKISCFCTEVN